MADDFHYVPGDWYMICERTGFKVRSRKMRKEWTGRMIRGRSWEIRQPQDFVRGVRDDQTVPVPRPRQTDVFLDVTTVTSAASVAGSTDLTLASLSGMLAGDRLSITLDSTGTFIGTIQSFPGGLIARLTAPLPSSVAAGNSVFDLDAPTRQRLTNPANYPGRF